MPETSRLGAAALALVCSVVFTIVDTAAQTGSPTPANPAPQAGATPNSGAGQITPTADQAQALLKSLKALMTQSASGFQPAVGASVPPDVKTQPMPPAAKAVLPEAKDHHVVKTDDQTILIVDPITRQVVGVISAMSDDGTTGFGTPNPGSGQ